MLRSDPGFRQRHIISAQTEKIAGLRFPSDQIDKSFASRRNCQIRQVESAMSVNIAGPESKIWRGSCGYSWQPEMSSVCTKFVRSGSVKTRSQSQKCREHYAFIGIADFGKYFGWRNLISSADFGSHAIPGLMNTLFCPLLFPGFTKPVDRIQ